jgi:hypothetical protein
MRIKIPSQMDRWFTEPHQLVITLVCLSVLLSVSVLVTHRLLSAPTLDAEALSKARSGVIVVKSADPRSCEQRTFNNETGTFGAPVPTSCDRASAVSAGSQLGSIREGFKGR